MLLGRKTLSKSELQFIRRQEKILADSIKVFSQTDSIDTFFSRYDLAEKTVRTIAEVSGMNMKCIAGSSTSPNECLSMLQKEKPNYTNDFLSRYIRKETVHILGLSRGQLNRAHGISAIIEEYADNMPQESLAYGRKLAEKLIAKVERAVK